jgi:prolipoprotein diacylglyceryltransferase
LGSRLYIRPVTNEIYKECKPPLDRIDVPRAAVYDCLLHGGADITYPWVFTAGVLLGMLWLILQNPDRQAPSQASHDLLPAAALALAIGLALARLSFAATFSRYYLEHPFELLWLWQGGLSGSGGLIGGLLGIWLYTRISKEPLLITVDQFALPALIVGMSCWTGCWLDGCAYGQPLQASLALFTTADMFGTRIARWPAALLGLLPLLAAFALLNHTVSSRLPNGRRAAMSFTALALGILLASLVRADPVPVITNLRLDTLAGLVLTIVGASALLISFHRGDR